MFSIWRVAGWH